MKRAWLVGLCLIGALMPIAPAAAEPKIDLLSPSPLITGQVPELSDKDSRPVHLVAWVAQIPLTPQVEFEIQPPGGPLPGQNPETVDGVRVGTTDTWEASYAIPASATEGQYTIVARLFSSQEEVATSSQIVTINRTSVPPDAENVELSYPDNAGPLGFYTPPGKRPVAVLRGTASADTEQVQGFYTKVAPGNDPEWIACGAGTESSGIAVVRCTLKEGDQGSQVTAVAAVANTTPAPGEPQRAGDDAMDAHRVSPYAQRPANIEIAPQQINAEIAKCRLFTLSATDQFGSPMTTLNIDVHAEGPTDQLHFATDDTSPVTNRTSPYQAPDKAHVSSENTPRCSDGANSQQQGDHNLIGSADRKHVESTTGTNNDGEFFFALISDVGGSSFVTAWADDDDDDTLQTSEVTGGAQVGWGQEPPEPPRELLIEPASSTSTTGSCQRVTLIAKQGGTPLAGVNLDVHASGPDASVEFCIPPEGASVARDPDGGSHVAGADDEDTRHLEGETDSSGRFAFGVTSSTEGSTAIDAWLDLTDDDVQGAGETSRSGSVSWTTSGERSISLESSRSSVRKGRNVRLFGAISGSDACRSNQVVRLQSKPRRGGSFRTVSSSATDEGGDYSFTVRVRKTKKYRAVAPLAGACEKATSRTVTVRAR